MPASTTSLRSVSPPSDNDVFAISHSLIPEPTHKLAGQTELAFGGLLSSPLILHEDLQGGCGGQLWPAGMTLARYLLQRNTLLSNKQILEIGAGVGLVGLAVASSGHVSSQVLITDQKPMLGLMQKNIQLNRLDSRVSAEVYDWGSKPTPLFQTSTGHPDIVLAADCVYFEPAFPLLMQTLDDLIGATTICYFCFKKRRKADMRFIRDMMKKFSVTELNYDEKKADRKDAIFLYELRRKSKIV